MTAKIIDVKQKSPEWHNLRKDKIGASEVHCLVNYYIHDHELEEVGIDPEKFRKEIPYGEINLIFNRFKDYENYLITTKDFSKENEMFGEAIERMAICFLSNRDKENIKYTRGEVLVDVDIQGIASLDIKGVIQTDNHNFKEDCNGRPLQAEIGSHFITEVKAISSFFKDKQKLAIDGALWGHIFQLQFQLMLSGASFGRVLYLSLKADNDFYRGQMWGLTQRFDFLADENNDLYRLYNGIGESEQELMKTILQTEYNSRLLEVLNKHFEIHEFLYANIPAYQNLIMKSLNRFFEALKNDQEPIWKDYNDLSKEGQAALNHAISKMATVNPDKNPIINNDLVSDYMKANNLKKQSQDMHDKAVDNIKKACVICKKNSIISSSNQITLSTTGRISVKKIGDEIPAGDTNNKDGE